MKKLTPFARGNFFTRRKSHVTPVVVVSIPELSVGGRHEGEGEGRGGAGDLKPLTVSLAVVGLTRQTCFDPKNNVAMTGRLQQ